MSLHEMRLKVAEITRTAIAAGEIMLLSNVSGNSHSPRSHTFKCHRFIAVMTSEAQLFILTKELRVEGARYYG
jgi:hypothetical protein